ncbi:MAG: hypothetical protein FRX48_05842 [Lasallia pustulata]|uniref:Uncharacterized protein n=1 Tax=Lasallia pustulata TaxID=136370 RepID=A0A5M8PLR5_9LECA|nr:MAG: hypothetical protein FRX48_05842 [Lasallia pustulata]
MTVEYWKTKDYEAIRYLLSYGEDHSKMLDTSHLWAEHHIDLVLRSPISTVLGSLKGKRYPELFEEHPLPLIQVVPLQYILLSKLA